MAFNDNQIFYAALWWVKSLPGGAQYADDICVNHGMLPAEFAVDPPVGNGPKSVSREECEDFFNALRTYLSTGKAELLTASHGEGRYIHLGNRAASGRIHEDSSGHYFSEALEHALKIANLDKNIMPHKPEYAHLYLHDDGQIFARIRLSRTFNHVAIAYPSQPSLPYRHISLNSEDFQHCPQVFVHTLYRVLPLKPGQEVHFGWPTLDGGRHELTAIAEEDDVLAVTGMALPDLEALGEDDILMFSSRIMRSYFANQEFFYPVMNGHGNRIEATDKPGIVREVSGRIFCMEVKETIQIGSGGGYFIARPGDRIMQGSAFNGVVRKEIIEAGEIVLVPCHEEKGVNTLPKGPNLS